ncbi:MAG TPA: M13 family peptidase, partial [Bacteroidales bacterium]|nr:M13 family peptidase [Bacteroidales bacterium]
MNRLFIPFVVLIIMLNLSCSEKKSSVKTDSIDVANIDTTALPGESFYQYATGGWQKNNPIPDEYARYGSFDKLRENNQVQIQELIQELVSQDNVYGSNGQKVGDMYTMGLDSLKLNKDGASPILPYLNQISEAKSREDIIRIMVEVSKIASNPFFGFSVGPDDKNSEMNIAHIYQSGISMGDRDYYLSNDKHSQNLRKGYKSLIETQFQNAGFSESDSRRAAKNVMVIETELAQAHITREMRRIPELNYHMMLVSELNNNIAPFEWNSYFDALGANNLDSINVMHVEPLKAAIAIINRETVQVLQDYLSWKIIDSSANYLSDDFVNANFEFYGKMMSGSKELRPRWRRTIDVVSGSMGEAVGQLYVQKYFPPEAKERMLKLVDNLTLSLSDRINQLEWMSSETKEKAQEKLGTFIVKIGYPDKWKDYSLLEIKDDSYWQNRVRVAHFAYNEMIEE